MMNDDEFFA